MKMNVKVEGRAFDVEIIDLSARPVKVLVDGEKFEVWVEEDLASPSGSTSPAPDTSVEEPAPRRNLAAVPASAPVNKTRAVPAPIPGVIVAINVREGDSVSFGQEL